MIAVEDGTVWADDSGGDGPPLVLLHPGIGDSRIWEPVLAPLTARYRVFRYDARGYGNSPAATVEFSLLQDLKAVLGHYGIERMAIVGCSQGGATALGLALAQPERVAAIVLLCPGIPGFPMSDEEEAAMVGPERYAKIEAGWTRAAEAKDVDGLADVMAGIWGAGEGGSTPAVLEQFRSAARASLFSASDAADPPVFDRLGEIAVPTSLLVGDADWPPLVEANRQAAERIPECEYTLVPGVDHVPPLRVPELVLDTITRTLARASW
ncbi:alpha/beta hydrolase [Trebonia kvetii]|uniref:Alpha/beta hydrolase n=1 Tax=Trebonia kvetii TaxID=2480626 RepID=A0A6P2BPD0_9ACTN|nr:alpha/beta hydrolase [Trebonia kvetii]TVZ00872.1 alpha/beta hydrolase [Trebonia kvetii]